LIRHDLHLHTTLSSCCRDPAATPANYLRSAEELGLAVIGFTDHLWDETRPGVSEWYRPQNLAHVMRIKKMLPSKGRVKVLFGCESEYCGNGKIGIGREAAAEFDFVLVPMSHLHMKEFVEPSWVRTPRDVAALMVTYFKELVEFDYITGIAHPFLPIGYENVNQILSYISKGEFEECFGKAAEQRISIEISTGHFPSINNGAETHEFNDETFLEMLSIAKKVDCRFHLATDAHELENLGRIVALEERAVAMGMGDAIHPLVEEAISG